MAEKGAVNAGLGAEKTQSSSEKSSKASPMTECVRVDALPFMSLLVHSGNVQGPVKAMESESHTLKDTESA